MQNGGPLRKNRGKHKIFRGAYARIIQNHVSALHIRSVAINITAGFLEFYVKVSQPFYMYVYRT